MREPISWRMKSPWRLFKSGSLVFRANNSFPTSSCCCESRAADRCRAMPKSRFVANRGTDCLYNGGDGQDVAHGTA